MATAGVRPFPWSSLDAVRGADVAALARVRRWAEACAPLSALREGLAGILGAPVDFRLRRAQRGGSPQRLDDAVAVLLSVSTRSGAMANLLVEADGPLAATLVARALKRPAPKIFAPGAPTSPQVAGALGAILVAAVRAAGASEPVVVLDAGANVALARTLRSQNPGLDTVTWTVTLGLEAFAARVTMPPGLAPSRDAVWDRRALASLGEAVIALPVVASVATASAADIAALREGDAWVPDRMALGPPAKKSDWTGPVWLAAPSAELGIAASLGEGGRLVVGGQSADLPWSMPTSALLDEPPMDDRDPNDAMIEAIADAPVVVRVEIGATQMRAREWAALAPGDVLSLARSVAEPVVLRVGGAELARGELVEIDGQLGVRILSKLPAIDSGR